MKFSTVTLLSAATLAAAQHHHHHRHHARHGSPVEARAPAVVETVAGPVVTVYELNGEKVTWDDVNNGLINGKYVLLGEKITAVKPAPSSSTTTTTTSKAVPTPIEQGAKLFEKPKTKAKPTTTTTTTPAPPPPSTTEAPPPPPTTTSAAPEPPKEEEPKEEETAAGNGVDSEFPSGKISCDKFPSDYGPIEVYWTNKGGWTGIQSVPGFNFGSDSTISYIEGGSGCKAGSFCSYACPAGYQKSQWPEAQGSTAQSIGGLYCNKDGMLELSRPSEKKLCIPGVGGIKVVNKLGSNAAVCRTDYPGDESETVPMNTTPGGEYELCNPDQSTYYQWQGAATSAQYYINNAGVPVNEACDWGVAGSNKGNWAPVNAGVGRGKDGVTYISLFPNAPTNPDGKLNFNVAIKGDVNGDCEYKNGNYYSNGNVAPTGCTVGVAAGKQAHFEFY